MINVVNKYKHKATDRDVYIGRGSALGNPYTGSKQLEKTKATYQCETAEEAIGKYREYLMEQITQKNEAVCTQLNLIWKMAKEGEVNLVCFCAPKPCHGEVVKELIESKL